MHHDKNSAAATLGRLGYCVTDLAEMSVTKDIAPGIYVLLSGWAGHDVDPAMGESDEPCVPHDLDAPAFYTIWREDSDDCHMHAATFGVVADDYGFVHHATLRAALDEIERLCAPVVDVMPPGVNRG